MALTLNSPSGVLSDEEECGAVFESTAADIGGQTPTQHFGGPFSEISVISPASCTQAPARKVNRSSDVIKRSSDNRTEAMKVYARVRPLTETEKERGEEQGCVSVQTDESLLLRAPKDSHSMKSAERGITRSMHKFSFTKIFGPQSTQQDVYDQMMQEMVRDVLHGENRLLYTYGVTNSGKTYTIQGGGGKAGLLPRALMSVFLKLSGRLYSPMDLKPVLCQEVRQLTTSEIRAEEIRRDALLKEEDGLNLQHSWLRGGGGPSSSWDSGVDGLFAARHIATQLEDFDVASLEADGLSLSSGEEFEEGVQVSVWVSFYEIYNEFLYDLLDVPPSFQQCKRATLRLSDDKHGNPYVKDLTWIHVCSADEAWRVLKAGRHNQSFASTHLNHSSSRSHSIFTIRLLHIKPDADQSHCSHISELLVCDLAGSERCKDQQNGERMKEANNINTSLLTLGRCISALRFNQANRSRPPQVVPFRDSKLTRVLQGFFCGRGRSCMVVNVNPCASTYDETLQALKFSAIATQLVHGPSTKTRVAYILSLLREQPTQQNDSTLREEEESYEEGDIPMFDPEELLRAIDVLKREVLRQRQEKEAVEAAVREQVWSEMMEVINRMQDDFSETLETERALMESRCENKINNLKTSLKKYYSREIEERDEQIRQLTAALEKKKGLTPAPIFPPLDNTEAAPRRSQRVASSHLRDMEHTQMELNQCRMDLDQCQAELDLKDKELQLKILELKRYKEEVTLPGTTGALTCTADCKLEESQRNLRQLRADLQSLGVELQSGERACCRNTDGAKLRQALATADSTLAKQDQLLAELYTSLQLVKGDLRRKAESLRHFQSTDPSPLSTPSTLGSCKKRGCAAAVACVENQPPEKRPFFRSLFPPRTPVKMPRPLTRQRAQAVTPYASVLRSRQPSPPPSPGLRRRRFNY
ncbi:kinesin-like protein KIF20A [Chanos chanos]|uniref:Kinesin-like protein n=1 Tax=Chanos chanos TaxID=29144 RepID=A0A6J2US06_CHACN|nr:kinesin-like protein KIF20A [Chanos chanos]